MGARKSMVEWLERAQTGDSWIASGSEKLTGVKVNVLSEENKDVLNKLLSVLRDGKSVTVVVLEHVLDKASKIAWSVWSDITDFATDKWEDITDSLPDSDDLDEFFKEKWDNAKELVDDFKLATPRIKEKWENAKENATLMVGS